MPSLKTLSIPSIIMHNPCPPASTTPAFLSTGSSSGVSARASAAPMHTAPQTYTGSLSISAAEVPTSAPRRETVRIVPSVGFITALYADSTPIERAFTRAVPSASSIPSSPFEKPRNNNERITPEFPLAPLSIDDAAVLEISPTVASSPALRSSATAAEMVIDMFVPVSPSGTGKILRSSTNFLLLTILFAPEMIASLS